MPFQTFRIPTTLCSLSRGEHEGAGRKPRGAEREYEGAERE